MLADDFLINVDNSKFDAAWLDDRAVYFQGLYEQIMDLRDHGKFIGRKIATVGCWNNFMEVNKIIENLGLTVSYIADNNPKKQGVSRLGIISQSVESLVYKKDLVILVINDAYWRELRQQLISLHFQENIDFFIVFGGRKFKCDAKGLDNASILSPQIWNESRSHAWDAFLSYKRINRNIMACQFG